MLSRSVFGVLVRGGGFWSWPLRWLRGGGGFSLLCLLAGLVVCLFGVGCGWVPPRWVGVLLGFVHIFVVFRCAFPYPCVYVLGQAALVRVLLRCGFFSARGGLRCVLFCVCWARSFSRFLRLVLSCAPVGVACVFSDYALFMSVLAFSPPSSGSLFVLSLFSRSALLHVCGQPIFFFAGLIVLCRRFLGPRFSSRGLFALLGCLRGQPCRIALRCVCRPSLSVILSFSSAACVGLGASGVLLFFSPLRSRIAFPAGALAYELVDPGFPVVFPALSVACLFPALL